MLDFVSVQCILNNNVNSFLVEFSVLYVLTKFNYAG
jgi:hypothetical protein